MARLFLIVSLLLLPGSILAATQLEIALEQRWLQDSNPNPVASDYSLTSTTLRIAHEGASTQWRWQLHYLLSGRYSPEWAGLSASAPRDAADPLWDLDARVLEGQEGELRQRLDRLWVSHSSDQWVFKLGRQAITWGSGHLFRPMDLFNPFSVTSVDTRYKPGLDMAYAQYLFPSGADLQMLYVPRRAPDSGDLSAALSSVAAKWLWFADTTQYELLLAKDYDEPLMGLSVAHPVGEALLSVDWVIADTDSDAAVHTLVAGVDYSWAWGRFPVSGYLEYFYNGFGASGGTAVGQLPFALQQRLARGQLFNLNRRYMGGGIQLQLSPLTMLNGFVVHNTDDHSALWGVSVDYSPTQSSVLRIGTHIPLGDRGSEFGGPELQAGIPQFAHQPQALYARLELYY